MMHHVLDSLDDGWCHDPPEIAIWLSKNCKKLVFFPKNCHWQFFFNENFWHFFWKKCQVFCNFLTVKWQFSGGSGQDTPTMFHLLSSFVNSLLFVGNFIIFNHSAVLPNIEYILVVFNEEEIFIILWTLVNN